MILEITIEPKRLHRACLERLVKEICLLLICQRL